MSSGEVKGNSTVTKSAGFALENEGSIDKSYSRVTVLASSGKIFSFAPQDTGITDCYWVGSTSDHEQTSQSVLMTLQLKNLHHMLTGCLAINGL